MTEQRPRRWRDRLGTRLAAAFMATTLATVTVVTAIAWTASGTGADTLLAERRDQVTSDVVAALESAYLATGGWERADLLPAHTLAAAAGAVLIVSTPDMGELPTPQGLDTIRRRLHGEDEPAAGRVDDATDATPEGPGDEAGEGAGEVQRRPTVDGGDGPSHEPSTSEPRDEIGTGGVRSPEEPVQQGRTEDEGSPPPAGRSGGPASDDGTSGQRETRSGLAEPRAEALGASVVAWLPGVPQGGAAAELSPTPDADAVDEWRELPIVIGGEEVGTATLVFVGLDLADPVAGFRETLARRLTLGVGLALLLALTATVFVTSQLTRPLRRLTADVDGLRHAGTAAVRSTLDDAPGEIGLLSAALAGMAEDLQHQERLRLALVADVEHELRTPVTILLGELEALRDGVLTADDQQLGSLQEEVQRIARLVEDVGALADAEAAGFTLALAPLDLAAVAAAAATGLELQLAAADLELRLRLEPVRVVGDARRLEQLVRNLLTNAAKFAPPGTAIEVLVGADGDRAVLQVDDRGPGFEAAELPHVFERFWRGSQVAGAGGSGIGLAVVDEVARAHGGNAAASNRPGGGARLTVSFPRADQPATGLGWGRSVPVGSGVDRGRGTSDS